LATLLRHGLLRKSFIPARDIRALRDMARYRRMLVQSATAEKNRILKLLEMAGIKLSTVVSDVFGKSGMDMIRALATGNTAPNTIAQMARSRLRGKLPELQLALDVVLEQHHRLMLRDQIARLDRTLEEVARYDALLEERAAPYDEHISLLCSIDGVQRVAAIEIFAEIGPDLSSFPTDGHFSSWAGTCPGQHESAGVRRNARRRRGNPYLQSILVECALAATRKKGTYLKDKYHRLRARRGTMRALFAVAHKLTRAVYRVLTTRRRHEDLGDTYLDRRNSAAVARNLIARLQRLGYDASSIRPLTPSPVPT
jgi:transposase